MYRETLRGESSWYRLGRGVFASWAASGREDRLAVDCRCSSRPRAGGVSLTDLDPCPDIRREATPNARLIHISDPAARLGDTRNPSRNRNASPFEPLMGIAVTVQLRGLDLRSSTHCGDSRTRLTEPLATSASHRLQRLLVNWFKGWPDAAPSGRTTWPEHANAAERTFAASPATAEDGKSGFIRAAFGTSTIRTRAPSPSNAASPAEAQERSHITTVHHAGFFGPLRRTPARTIEPARNEYLGPLD